MHTYVKSADKEKKAMYRKKRSLLITKAETTLTKENVGYLGGGREKGVVGVKNGIREKEVRKQENLKG